MIQEFFLNRGKKKAHDWIRKCFPLRQHSPSGLRRGKAAPLKRNADRILAILKPTATGGWFSLVVPHITMTMGFGFFV